MKHWVARVGPGGAKTFFLIKQLEFHQSQFCQGAQVKSLFWELKSVLDWPFDFVTVSP